MHIDERGRTVVAELAHGSVRVFESGAFKGMVHILQSGDTVALYTVDRVDALIAALQEAKKYMIYESTMDM